MDIQNIVTYLAINDQLYSLSMTSLKMSAAIFGFSFFKSFQSSVGTTFPLFSKANLEADSSNNLLLLM